MFSPADDEGLGELKSNHGFKRQKHLIHHHSNRVPGGYRPCGGIVAGRVSSRDL